MGWKAVRDHYRIVHTVRVEGDCICIGSPYIHDIIRIRMDGTFEKRERSYANEDLDRYQREMDADPETLRWLITEPDTFERSLPVYTYNYQGEILEKQCEALGWPNITHDGCIQYDNTFSPDRAKVVRWAKRELGAAVKHQRERVREVRGELEKVRGRLKGYREALQRLKAEEG